MEAIKIKKPKYAINTVKNSQVDSGGSKVGVDSQFKHIFYFEDFPK